MSDCNYVCIKGFAVLVKLEVVRELFVHASARPGILPRNSYLLTRTSVDGGTVIVGAAASKGVDFTVVATR